ncbi:hypothetical protein ACFL1S_05695 [Pseudomonadota bacterium]
MKLINRNYDPAGMTSGRMMREQLLGKLRPPWCISSDLELKHLVALAVRQYLGYPISFLITRYSRQWQKALNAWRRIRPSSPKSGHGA